MKNLLWVDCIAGGVAGITMLVLLQWLSGLYALPPRLLLINAAANLIYASYSFALATRPRRPRSLIHLLVFANLAWTVVCLALAVAFAGSASVFGILHLVIEAVFVGRLATLEWKWRELLLTAA
jgi:hypothetical protein